jgi:hypothetical protein
MTPFSTLATQRLDANFVIEIRMIAGKSRRLTRLQGAFAYTIHNEKKETERQELAAPYSAAPGLIKDERRAGFGAASRKGKLIMYFFVASSARRQISTTQVHRALRPAPLRRRFPLHPHPLSDADTLPGKLAKASSLGEGEGRSAGSSGACPGCGGSKPGAP